ncbi:hypothetical protein [Streptomyces sp. NWU339]|nr:hypothetical protein [Streptomyces sp. NWU339]
MAYILLDIAEFLRQAGLHDAEPEEVHYGCCTTAGSGKPRSRSGR